MRIVRTALIIVFILSLGTFGISELLEMQNQDTTLPEITSDREVLEISCDYTEEDLLAGLSAYDETDGDLTSQIIPGSFSWFIEDGVCNLTYVVFDSSDQPASLTRRVQFTDYHSPRFTLSQPLVFAVQEGSYTEAMNRLGAEDMLDGDRDDWIVQTDTDVNYQTEGSYTMTVEVSNSFGDVSTAALPVHVVNPERQNLTVSLSAAIVYIGVGENVDPDAYVAGVTDAEGDSLDTDIVSASSNVDPETPGCYEIHYQASDGDGQSGENWLTVIVED